MSASEIRQLLFLRARPLIIFQASPSFSHTSALIDELQESFRTCPLEKYEQLESRPVVYDDSPILHQSTYLDKVQLARFLYDSSETFVSDFIIDTPVLLLYLGHDTIQTQPSSQKIMTVHLSQTNGVFRLKRSLQNNDNTFQDHTVQSISECTSLIRTFIKLYFESILESGTQLFTGSDIASRLFSLSKKLIVRQPSVVESTLESTLKALYASFYIKQEDVSRVVNMLQSMELTDSHRVCILLLLAISENRTLPLVEDDIRYMISLWNAEKSPLSLLILFYYLQTSENFYHFFKIKVGPTEISQQNSSKRIAMLCLLFSASSPSRTRSMILRSLEKSSTVNNIPLKFNIQEQKQITSWNNVDFPLINENLSATLKVGHSTITDEIPCEFKVFNNSPVQIFADFIFLAGKVVAECQTYDPFIDKTYTVSINNDLISNKSIDYTLTLRSGIQLGGPVFVDKVTKGDFFNSDGMGSLINERNNKELAVSTKFEKHGGMLIMVSNISGHFIRGLSVSCKGHHLLPSNIELLPSKSAVFFSLGNTAPTFEIFCHINEENRKFLFNTIKSN